jgi:hypothetical protein
MEEAKGSEDGYDSTEVMKRLDSVRCTVAYTSVWYFEARSTGSAKPTRCLHDTKG